MATSEQGPLSSRLFIVDKESKKQFLIDTGADVSVIPVTEARRKQNNICSQLHAANGSTINVYGTQLITLNLGLRRTFQWPFVVASVTKPIIGADFLSEFGLVVDLKNKKLFDRNTSISVVGSVQKCQIPTVKSFAHISEYQKLLSKYPNITRPPTFNSPTVKHQVVHRIPTTGSPCFSQPR